MTAAGFVEAAARRHRLQEWIDTNRLPGELYVRHWFLDRNGLPALRRRHERRLPGGLGATSGVWSVGRDSDRLLRVDVCEQPSRVHAHRALPQVLAQVQSPVLVRDVDLGIGDVTFSLPRGLVVIFARANLVVIVASVGRRPVDSPGIAAAIDRSIVRTGTVQPAPSDAAVPLSLDVVREPGPVRRVDVRLGTSVRRAGLPMVKVYAPPGRLYEERSGLRYLPADDSAAGWLSLYAQERGPSGPARRLMVRKRT